MSYDISLNDPVTDEEIVFLEPHEIGGGIRSIDKSNRAYLSVTYNYSRHFLNTVDSSIGINVISGMTGAESIPILEAAISKLGDDVSSDYWEPTEGNAKRALCGLLAFAQLRPDGIWEVL